MSIREITAEMSDLSDIIYFSARKLGCARGGGICTNNEDMYLKIRELVTLYEGFLTYGGMSVREIEAIAVGLEETMDENMINQGPQFIAYMVKELEKKGVPVITPAGGLGCHINAMEFVDHIPQEQYPAGALAAAIYLISGVRGMERGTMSEQRGADGNETFANMELVRLALPRRVFTLSQVNYAVDRIAWLYENRKLIGGLTFVEEPKVLRFFFGRLKPTSDWQVKLVEKFREDFGDSL
jgi:tyrosine phenol-lyase